MVGADVKLPLSRGVGFNILNTAIFVRLIVLLQLPNELIFLFCNQIWHNGQMLLFFRLFPLGSKNIKIEKWSPFFQQLMTSQ
jgi:hypothetical protein